MEKKTKTKKEAKPKETGLFDIIRWVFCDPQKLYEAPKELLEKNFFMANRIFSIQFPLQANAFQCTTKTNGAEALKCWADFMKSKGYTRVPGFVFTKGAQRSKEDKERAAAIPDSLIREYAKHYKTSVKDVNSALKLVKGAEQDLADFKEMLEAKVEKQKISKR